MGVANNAAVSPVASSASVVTLLAHNNNRKGFLVANDSTAILYIKFGSGASTTDYSVKVAANGGSYEHDHPSPYVGIVTGIWASANGYAYVTETI